MSKTYLIEYRVLDKSGQVLKAGKMKVKNKMNDLHAKTELELFLKKKLPSFDKLIVDSCIEDYDGSNFMDYFSDIVKGTPFG